jgi:hypothetical protein
MPEDMPDSMPEDMPDKLPEDMSDRMPEDFPVTKRIDVMVGITRSKVIFCSMENQYVDRLKKKRVFLLTKEMTMYSSCGKIKTIIKPLLKGPVRHVVDLPEVAPDGGPTARAFGPNHFDQSASNQLLPALHKRGKQCVPLPIGSGPHCFLRCGGARQPSKKVEVGASAVLPMSVDT